MFVHASSRWSPYKIWPIQSRKPSPSSHWDCQLDSGLVMFYFLTALSKIWREISWKFHVIFMNETAFWSKLTPNSMTIPCHLSRFYLLPICKNMTWTLDLRKVKVMEFLGHLIWKWWDFLRIWSHFRTKPNCRQKDMRKSLSHFYRVDVFWMSH